MDSGLRGRWAPSPTGRLHLGNARTALVAWLSVRSRGGRFVWRVEDVDTTRAVPGRAAEQARDLAWLGLDWDEGPWAEQSKAPGTTSRWRETPDAGGWQSRRGDLYLSSLRDLAARGLVFPCRLSRRDVQAAARAPHGAVSGACGAGMRAPAYPPSLRPTAIEDDWLARVLGGEFEAAVRLRVDAGEITFDDALYGVQREDPSTTTGDFVLRRRDGLFAYQLAVVVDDAAQEIDEVVRGADLLDSTAGQIYLQRALGLKTPRYGHVPLLLNCRGEKLSKRDEALDLTVLRDAGVSAPAIVGYLAFTLGLAESLHPIDARELISGFSWSALRREPVRVPADIAHQLLEVDR